MAVEFWSEGADRFHHRVRYERTLTRSDDFSFTADPWGWQWLQP